MRWYSILLNISIFSLLVPIFSGVFRLRVLNWEIKLFITYLIIAFTLAISLNWFTNSEWIAIILHMNTLVEYLVVMVIICSWQESQKMKNLLKVLLWSYVLFWFFAKVTFEPINGLYSITSSISQVILALSAGYTLFVVIGNHEQLLLRNQLFWVLIAFILNYTGTLIPTALADVFFTQRGEALILLQSINWVLVIFSNILFALGILCPPTLQSLS
jgi:hypothetical protein